MSIGANFFNNLRHPTTALLLVPLACSAFTFLWNPLGFIDLTYGEGTYLGRAMHVLLAQNPQEGTFYDHPYFGHLFLAGVFWVTGFPNSLHPSAGDDVVNSVKMLWLVPKLLIGILGVIDTFLIYKISERRYNSRVAFMAAIIFAIMPLIYLRTIWLESLQLPFVLSSILFAINAKDSTKNNNNRKNEAMALISGIFMGLAIFTKISIFAMIPLIGFLIYKDNKSVKTLGLWFIPVILISLIWPGYALTHGEFDYWLDGIYWQTHRQEEYANLNDFAKSLTLPNAIVANFLEMPILVAIGLAGLVFATVRKDFFLLLWTVPFLVYLFFIGLVRDYHLIPLLPALCISAARLIEGLSEKITYRKVRNMLPFSIISAIAIFGLINVMVPLATKNNDNAFTEAALVVRYLEENKNSNITLISDRVYSWIPKYVFHLGSDYRIPEIGVDWTPKTEKVLMVVNDGFKSVMRNNNALGEHLIKIYNEHSKNGTSTVEVGSDKIILPQHWSSNFTKDHGLNVIDNEHG